MPIEFHYLRKMAEDDLIERYDDAVTHASTGGMFNLPSHAEMQLCMTELNRRSQERQTETMLACTKWIAVMTAIVTIATVVNVVAYIAR